jgi:hypothetical protein
MKKVVLAGAVALVMAGSSVFSVASAQSLLPVSATSGVSQAQIGQLKAVLNLTPEQEVHWPALESALRQVRGSAVDAIALKRLLAAARPLIKSLDEGQKRTALRLAHSLGLASVAAAAF